MTEIIDTAPPLVRERSSVRITPAAPLNPLKTLPKFGCVSFPTFQLTLEQVQNKPTGVGESWGKLFRPVPLFVGGRA